MSKFKEAASGIDKKIYAVYTAFKREDTPLYAKLACGMCVWYALSPLDLVPDFIPVLGAIDDIVIMPLLIWMAVKMIPADIMRECEIEAANMDVTDKKTFIRYSIPIILIWTVLAVWLIHTIVKYIPMPL